MRYRFALLTAVFFCAFAAGAKSPTTMINVQVTTMDGKPIEHADVDVKLVKGEKARTMWKLRTHEEGIVKALAEIPQGTILVEVTASGYQTFSQTFEVHEDRKTIEVKLNSAMTKINVQVTTLGGKPIDHADVVVKFVKGRSIIELGRKLHTSWEMRTNQEGIAKVPEIPQGTILIQVIATGYQTFGQTFEVNELEKTIEVKLNSPQEQYSAH
jgi:nitrogen fixation protein FixH